MDHFSSLTRLKGSWDQLWPKTNPKQEKTKTKTIIFPRGLPASKFALEAKALNLAVESFGAFVACGCRAVRLESTSKSWLSGVLCNSHKTKNYPKLPQNYPKLPPNYPQTTPKLPQNYPKLPHCYKGPQIPNLRGFLGVAANHASRFDSSRSDVDAVLCVCRETDGMQATSIIKGETIVALLLAPKHVF